MELLPCPFCGGKAEEQYTGTTVTNTHTYQYGVCECRECGAMSKEFTNKDDELGDQFGELVRSAWNSRV